MMDTEDIIDIAKEERWLICGTRKKGYEELVFEKLDELIGNKLEPHKPNSIIEGCCPDSADAYAEEWATREGITIQHHPSTSGNYLKRNIEMVKKATLVIAFWDGFSYGTAHTIAQAVMRDIPVIVVRLKEDLA
jgi:hypothetical protein